MEKLMSFQEVTRLSYIERDLSADSGAQGDKNLTIDATQLRKITDQLKQAGTRLNYRVTQVLSNYDDFKAMHNENDKKLEAFQLLMLERKGVMRSYLSDWRRNVLARPTILAKELKIVAQQKRWKQNPLIKEIDEYLATEPEGADEERL